MADSTVATQTQLATTVLLKPPTLNPSPMHVPSHHRGAAAYNNQLSWKMYGNRWPYVRHARQTVRMINTHTHNTTCTVIVARSAYARNKWQHVLVRCLRRAVRILKAHGKMHSILWTLICHVFVRMSVCLKGSAMKSDCVWHNGRFLGTG